MRKTTLRSEWEDIPGFDRIRGKYIRLDGDAWLTAHRIREEGERRGKRNQPGTDESQPDGMFQKIENWVRKRALDCKEEVGKYIGEELAYLHDLRSFWDKENPEIDLDALVTQRCQDLQAIAEQSWSDLDTQRAEYEEAARDLKNFRERNGLSRVAHYPHSQLAHWLWIPVAGVVETFVGANLLGSVSRGGVIEGWMVAAVLTVVNILLGLWAGKVWRSTHYRWGFVRLSAYVQSGALAAVALVWNDVAGHVRDVYVNAEKTGTLEAPDAAFASAYRTMIASPVPWESLQSAGLVFVGSAVFAITAYKAYTADDPFPGYGRKHRKLGSLREQHQDDLNDALDDLESARNESNVAIDEIKKRCETDKAGWDAAHDRLRMIVEDYRVNLRQYNKDLAYLLAAYRDANLAARTTAPPAFFDIEPTVDEGVLQPPEVPLPDPPRWGNIPEKAKGGFERVHDVYAALRERFRMLYEAVDDYAEETT